MGVVRAPLRGKIDKWLGASSLAPRRVTRVHPRGLDCRGDVQVDVNRESGEPSLYFFGHSDGSWRVFPPV